MSGVLRITNYSIRSHPDPRYYMQAWKLEGSNDDEHYEILDNRPQNADLRSSSIGQYPANPQGKSFQYFKIKQTMPTPSGYKNMRISGLDFYGSFIAKQITCKCRKCENNRYSLFIYNILIIS